jgi:hypothetical protein
VTMDDKLIHFCDDDGAEINPDILAKPSLCAPCAKDDDPSQEPICALIRLDQQEDIRRSRVAGFAGPRTQPVDLRRREAMIRQVAS